MRYTRTKQLVRLTGGKYWEYMPNVRIDEMRKLLSDYELDKSFKWNREYNWWRTSLVNWITFERNLDLVGFNGRNTAIITVKKGYTK